jgi:hypothetical protein
LLLRPEGDEAAIVWYRMMDLTSDRTFIVFGT